MVRSGDRDGVDRLVFEDFANIGIGLWPLSRRLLYLTQTLVEDGGIDVAQRGDFDILHFEILADMGISLPPDTDDGDTNRVSRASRAGQY